MNINLKYRDVPVHIWKETRVAGQQYGLEYRKKELDRLLDTLQLLVEQGAFLSVNHRIVRPKCDHASIGKAYDVIDIDVTQR